MKIMRAIKQMFSIHSRQQSNQLKSLSVVTIIVLFLSQVMLGSVFGAQAQSPKHTVTVKIVDENGVAVSNARVIVLVADSQKPSQTETDISGRAEIAFEPTGKYQIHVEKEGFYTTNVDNIQLDQTNSVQLTLNHQQEYKETIDVTDSPQAIDPDKTAVNNKLTNREIINLPYPATHDYRNALPLIPGVLRDPTGQVHINGAETYQINDQLDGFNITDPANGLLQMRVSVDAIREMTVETSRASTEFGKGSAGFIKLTTGMGDDHLRFAATNFIPSFQTTNGLQFDNWTPRVTVSGPLLKQKAWFFNASDAEYKLNIIKELPSNSNNDTYWHGSNLTKAQMNLTDKNILSGSFLINRYREDNFGLSVLTPQPTTQDLSQTAHLGWLKDQAYLPNGFVLENGLGINDYGDEVGPHGSLPYSLSPNSASGNYFLNSDIDSQRIQWFSRLTMPSITWMGRHEISVGNDLDQITYSQLSNRQPISILREDGTLDRFVSFTPGQRFDQSNLQESAYGQDRWLPNDRMLIETGVRLDWDRLLGRAVISPRIGGSYTLSKKRETKLSVGIGRYTDETSLSLITRPMNGVRFDQFFAADGITPIGQPVETSFMANLQNLNPPTYLNWSAGVEQRLPWDVYLQANYIQRQSNNAFVYVNEGTGLTGQYELTNARQDRYKGLEITLKRLYKGNSAFLVSYTRSSARSNAVIDYTLDNPVFSQQGAGPLPWDSPNRVVAWGWQPLIRNFSLAYSVDWRDGYPFSIVNQSQEIVGSPNSNRFPDYFALNMHIEKRFSALGFQWAVRAGFNNITNHQNPNVVNNNIDSPNFLTFSSFEHRAFTARIRFLGRK